MNKYAILIILIFCIASFGASFAISQDKKAKIASKNWNNYGITFKYPLTWKIGKLKVSQVALVVDPTSYEKTINDYLTSVVILKIKNVKLLQINQAAWNNLKNQLKKDNPSFIITSERKFKIDGLTAFEAIFKSNKNGALEVRLSTFIKNGNAYIIQSQTLPKNFNSNKANFNMIISSLHVK
jgi:PsbP-like protein